nr:MAG TPA: tail tube protein [Caudoviricetes sp.]
MPENTPNKVKFGLKNVHYALLTIAENGAISFAKPVPIPGAVNLTMDAQGETSTFYADNGAYFVTTANDGYSGSLEVALIPDSFRQDVLHESLDPTAQVLVENVANQTSPYALLFEFDGDQRAIRHVLYNCTCTRPSVTGSTTTNTKDPTTETMNLTASPLPNGNSKARTTANTPAAQYASWYDAVWQPLNELVVVSSAGSSAGDTVLTVSPALSSGNIYKYQTGASVQLPAYGETVGSGWTEWDGSEEIPATSGQQIAVVEVNASGQAVAGGVATVVANGG